MNNELTCTCKMVHSFIYKGCMHHGIPHQYISTKEIVEIKEELSDLRKAWLETAQLVEIIMGKLKL